MCRFNLEDRMATGSGLLESGKKMIEENAIQWSPRPPTTF